MNLTAPCRILTGVTTTLREVERLAKVRAACASGEARRIRQAARLSLADVAGAIGVDLTAISRWERGERSPRGAAALRYGELLDRLERSE